MERASDSPRPGMALVASRPFSAMRLGHVAWGYSRPAAGDDVYTVGSVEDSRGLPYAPPARMEFWQLSAPGEEASRLVAKLGQLGYQRFKFWPVADPDPDAADRISLEQSERSYLVCGNNCLDSVHRILTAYGADAFHLHDLRHPRSWIPNAWYGSIPEPSLPLPELARLARRSRVAIA